MPPWLNVFVQKWKSHSFQTYYFWSIFLTIKWKLWNVNLLWNTFPICQFTDLQIFMKSMTNKNFIHQNFLNFSNLLLPRWGIFQMTESDTSNVSDVISHSFSRFNIRVVQSLAIFRNNRNSCQLFSLSTFDELTIYWNVFWLNWNCLGFGIVCCGGLLHEFFPVWWRLLNCFNFWSVCLFDFRSLLLLFLYF